MRQQTSHAGGNALFDLLSTASANAFDSETTVTTFEAGAILVDSNEPIERAYFPIDMMISTTTLMRDAAEVEVGSIGCEGMSGVQLALGIDHVPGKAICQVAGSALSLPASVFVQRLDHSAGARTVMLRYIQATINLLEISIACNALHDVTARCARWLLLTHDRVRRDEFGLTQEFLANMLGVRRATVNAAAQDLLDEGAIRYARGRLQIVDRARLESASCECYSLGIKRYSELLGQSPFLRGSGNGVASAVRRAP